MFLQARRGVERLLRPLAAAWVKKYPLTSLPAQLAIHGTSLGKLGGLPKSLQSCNPDALGSWPTAWLQSSRDSSRCVLPHTWHQSVPVRAASAAAECSERPSPQPWHQLVPRRAASATPQGPGSDAGQQEADEARLAAMAERLTLEAARLLGMGRLEHAEYLLADGERLPASPWHEEFCTST